MREALSIDATSCDAYEQFVYLLVAENNFDAAEVLSLVELSDNFLSFINPLFVQVIARQCREKVGQARARPLYLQGKVLHRIGKNQEALNLLEKAAAEVKL